MTAVPSRTPGPGSPMPAPRKGNKREMTGVLSQPKSSASTTYQETGAENVMQDVQESAWELAQGDWDFVPRRAFVPMRDVGGQSRWDGYAGAGYTPKVGRFCKQVELGRALLVNGMSMHEAVSLCRSSWTTALRLLRRIARDDLARRQKARADMLVTRSKWVPLLIRLCVEKTARVSVPPGQTAIELAKKLRSTLQLSRRTCRQRWSVKAVGSLVHIDYVGEWEDIEGPYVGEVSETPGDA